MEMCIFFLCYVSFLIMKALIGTPKMLEKENKEENERKEKARERKMNFFFPLGLVIHGKSNGKREVIHFSLFGYPWKTQGKR